MLLGKNEEIENVLRELHENVPQIEGAAVVSVEGLPIAASLPPEIDDVRLAAITAAILSLGERAVQEFEKGIVDEVYVRGSDGYILVMGAGPNAVITASATKDANLGVLRLYMKRAAEKIAQLI
ncbi:MAG: roadblock/LC7 domain-containing protein [Candidatus Freyarchaeota archaeon]|nr:roadblock/LC7 domain-containing protein [Candidatus Freyrarchaeum guaymaensis]